MLAYEGQMGVLEIREARLLDFRKGVKENV